jgi:hypothetical protein
MRGRNKAYRTFLFKQRMLDIICIMLRDNPTICYFCKKPFKPSDFPIKGRDKVDIHHVTYVPEYKVLAHHKCHLNHHKEQRKLAHIARTRCTK